MLNKTHMISYDVSGNITQVKEALYTTGTPTVFTQTINYGYDSQNKDRLITVGNETISSYDAMGNPWVYRGNPFIWMRGRLITQCKNAAFFYDADGVRKEKVVGTTVTKYYTEGNRIHKETRGNDTLWYYYDQTGVTAMDYNGVRYFFQKNIQGDIIRIYDTTGVCVARYIYDAWGNHKVYDASGVENTSATVIGNINPFRYRGYYYDTDTKYYHLDNRLYDPEIRRFINADEISYLNPFSINNSNLFSYANDNPIIITYSNAYGSSNRVCYIGSISSAKQLHNKFLWPNLDFLGKGFSYIENTFSMIAGAVDGIRKLKNLSNISGLEKTSKILMGIGITLNIGLSLYNNLTNSELTGEQKAGNIVGDIIFIGVNSATTWGVAALTAMIPIVGPFISPIVGLGLGTVLDQFWHGENILGIDGLSFTPGGKSIDEWIKYFFTKLFGG